MNLIIKATNYTLTDEMRDLIHKKFDSVARLLPNKGGSDVLDLEVATVHQTHKGEGVYRAEASLDAEGKLFRAEAEAATMEGALELTRTELMREVQASHGRARRLMRRAGVSMKSLFRRG
jgi:ribosome-associated translation inhibitor RaiA